MIERYSCARAAGDRGESLVGTASTVPRWVAVEQPGPWGTDALWDSRLDGAVARGLDELGDQLGARIVLIRRHGGGSDGHCRVLVADAGTDPPWMEELVLGAARELLEADLVGLAEGTSVGGDPLEAPRYLVCTHGSHDPCCAEFGRPAAEAVAAAAGERGWETSHIGGDRFAGNLLVLPAGVYYGRLDPAAAARVVAAHDEGRLVLDHYRGTVRWPFPVQAAEGLLRRELGEDRVGAVRPVAVAGARGNVRRVVFAVEGQGRLAVDVAVRRTVAAHRLTCRSEQPRHAPSYALVAVHAL